MILQRISCPMTTQNKSANKKNQPSFGMDVQITRVIKSTIKEMGKDVHSNNFNLFLDSLKKEPGKLHLLMDEIITSFDFNGIKMVFMDRTFAHDDINKNSSKEYFKKLTMVIKNIIKKNKELQSIGESINVLAKKSKIDIGFEPTTFNASVLMSDDVCKKAMIENINYLAKKIPEYPYKDDVVLRIKNFDENKYFLKVSSKNNPESFNYVHLVENSPEKNLQEISRLMTRY